MPAGQEADASLTEVARGVGLPVRPKNAYTGTGTAPPAQTTGAAWVLRSPGCHTLWPSAHALLPFEGGAFRRRLAGGVVPVEEKNAEEERAL